MRQKHALFVARHQSGAGGVGSAGSVQAMHICTDEHTRTHTLTHARIDKQRDARDLSAVALTSRQAFWLSHVFCPRRLAAKETYLCQSAKVRFKLDRKVVYALYST